MNENVRAKKSLGQNFLTDPNIQRKIVAALEPRPDDTVVEIGPGLGALTSHLLGQVQRLIAIELDDQLAARLAAQHGARDDFQLIHDDALEVDFATLQLPQGYKIIGNIPYNITTPLIFKLLEARPRAGCIVLMVQKEVAIRVAAAPDHKDYGALSVGVQVVAQVERLFTVPRGAFRPVPGVDSAILRLTPRKPPLLEDEEERDLRSLTRTTFSQRRKQLQKILRTAPNYELPQEGIAHIESSTGLRLERRPETLSPEQFIQLARALRSMGLPTSGAA
jgi:16S rRNA (adenine1518-N6/adenine1519-N6)-dimethyltransferase